MTEAAIRAREGRSRATRGARPLPPAAASRPIGDTWLVLAALLPAVGWEFGGLDLPLAHLAGNAGGFPLHENWWLTAVLHEGARALAWALVLCLTAAVRWPVGVLRRLTMAERLQLVATPVIATAVVGLLKQGGGASCPWDLADFGGTAQATSHWFAYLHGDGGNGHCFPAGHASAGFGFVGGWFALRERAPAAARRWLCAALAAGFALGVAQQWRGAHFMSHTLWTGWLCFALAGALDALRRAVARPPLWLRQPDSAVIAAAVVPVSIAEEASRGR